MPLRVFFSSGTEGSGLGTPSLLLLLILTGGAGGLSSNSPLSHITHTYTQVTYTTNTHLTHTTHSQLHTATCRAAERVYDPIRLLQHLPSQKETIGPLQTQLLQDGVCVIIKHQQISMLKHAYNEVRWQKGVLLQFRSLINTTHIWLNPVSLHKGQFNTPQPQTASCFCTVTDLTPTTHTHQKCNSSI